MKVLLLLVLLAPGPALGQEQLVAECSGRSFLHRIYFTGGNPPGSQSYRYERRTFFGETLQENFPVRFDEADAFSRRCTFSSIESGLIFAVTATEQKKNLRGVTGRQASAYNYRKPGSGPLDYTGNCWIDYDLALRLPTWQQ